ncbi:Dna polymerase, partial [Thalictrum thalictroides]
TYATQRHFTHRNSSSLTDYSVYHYWGRLKCLIESVRWKNAYPGCINASMIFSDPYPRTIDFEILTLAFIQLVEHYAYNIDSEYLKFTIGYNMQVSSSYEIPFTLGNAIPLCDPLGLSVNKKMLYDKIDQLVRLNGEKYNDAVVNGVFIRIYYESKDSLKPLDFPDISYKELMDKICNVIKDSEIVSVNLPEVKSLLFKKSRNISRITSIKSKVKQCRPFIVADLETVVENDVHIPYAAGYLVVKPGDDLTSLPSYSIQTFFSENHKTFYPNFKDRSERILFDFLYNLEELVKNEQRKTSRIRTVYFHNFSRFDGIFILRYYADRGKKYKIKTLLRNHKLYELKLYLCDRLLLRFRDSLTLLPGSLKTLGKTLCPELGSKGSIPHEELSVSNIHLKSVDLINYLRQDIVLLGGVMLKAQQIYWNKYSIDIEDMMTLTSLSLKIFRQNFFDDETFHINIPNRNQDTFIRRGYYGGHVDVYKPHGENLYYYDVNSLYPYIMKSYPMPCGVFYSEELKFTRELGYHVIPLRGYLFEKKESPFDGFISQLYESRLEAKKDGDEAMSFIYKILMNSLYGRFGMNPESTVTEICNQKKYEKLMKKDNFQSAEKLNDHYYIVNYVSNKSFADNNDDDWKPTKMSAVHLAAAITACARIHMYPYISRTDCYYTDTDSIVLGSPLPDDMISSMELGKVKLE